MVSEQRALRTTQIGPQLHHWWFADERIGGAQSDSYALYTRAGFIFVDALPMMYLAAEAFPSVGVAFMTRGCHERACWRYQFEHGARVLAPRNSPGLRTEPDQHYVEGTRLPADFQAIRTPGGVQPLRSTGPASSRCSSQASSSGASTRRARSS
jgi:hypothetical protein